MPMDIVRLRKLVALDESDALSRFALGKKLFEEGTTPAEWQEAVTHLGWANQHAPEHLATYHILAQTLIRLNRFAEARQVLERGIERTADIGEGMGRDLGPAMAELLRGLPDA